MCFNRQGAAVCTLFGDDLCNQRCRVFQVKMISADVPQPGCFGCQRQVDIAHDQSRLIIARREHHGLRAVDADPGVIAAQIVEVLRGNADAGVEACFAKCLSRAVQSRAVLFDGEGGKLRVHGGPRVQLVGVKKQSAHSSVCRGQRPHPIGLNRLRVIWHGDTLLLHRMELA